MKKVILVVLPLFLLGFVIAGCSDAPDPHYMKYSLVDQNGNSLGDIIVFGTSEEALDEALSLRGLRKGEPWGGGPPVEQIEGDPMPVMAPGGGYWCGDYDQADPAGDSCEYNKRSCYCFSDVLVVEAWAHR